MTRPDQNRPLRTRHIQDAPRPVLPTPGPRMPDRFRFTDWAAI